MKRLSATEVLDIAVRIEENGSEFYDDLASSSPSQEAVSIYQYLAGQEKQHIRYFQGLSQRMGETSQADTADRKHEGYLEALAEAHMLVSDGSGIRLAHSAANHAEATKAAMQFEKDTILLFEALKDLVPEPEKSTVDTLIAQEKMHLLDLYHFSATHRPSDEQPSATQTADHPTPPEIPARGSRRRWRSPSK